MADMKKQDDQNRGQNVPVRQQGRENLPERQQRGRGEIRSPFQLMRDLMRDPFGAMMPTSEFAPQMEVRETKDAFLFKADLPGIRKDDIDINVHGSRLQISGCREDEHEDREGDRVYAYERSYGSFSRAFTLPDSADTEHITCDLKDGVLSIAVPKKPGAQPRKIQIGGGSKA